MDKNSDFEWEFEEVPSVSSPKPQKGIDTTVLYDAMSSMLEKDDYESIMAFLQEKAKIGRDVPHINTCIAQLLRSDILKSEKYWHFVHTLLKHNAKMFLSTLSKNRTPEVSGSPCEKSLLTEIIKFAFEPEDKLIHAISLVSSLSRQLSFEQKDYILGKCLRTKNGLTSKTPCLTEYH